MNAGNACLACCCAGQWRGLPAAIKTIVSNEGDPDERRARLSREAALTCTLSHPNVVPTYHFEVDPVGAMGAGGGDAADG